MRAGADAFVALPAQIEDVVTRITELLSATAPIRIAC
jgi:hypothetical protein